MCDAKAVANSFLQTAHWDGQEITPMKLQKLVYFAHGWHLAIKDSPLLREHVQAWSYGPVIPSLYHSFKEYGNDPITNLTREWDGEEFSAPLVTDGEVKALLSRVWEVYGRFTAIQLSKMTHEPGSPWDVTWRRCGGRKGTDIPNDEIKAYFLALETPPV
jgi:uncharacterized phage-associated protein